MNKPQRRQVAGRIDFRNGESFVVTVQLLEIAKLIAKNGGTATVDWLAECLPPDIGTRWRWRLHRARLGNFLTSRLLAGTNLHAWSLTPCAYKFLDEHTGTYTVVQAP